MRPLRINMVGGAKLKSILRFEIALAPAFNARLGESNEFFKFLDLFYFQNNHNKRFEEPNSATQFALVAFFLQNTSNDTFNFLYTEPSAE